MVKCWEAPPWTMGQMASVERVKPPRMGGRLWRAAAWVVDAPRRRVRRAAVVVVKGDGRCIFVVSFGFGSVGSNVWAGKKDFGV
jgi:hypothetical protein